MLSPLNLTFSFLSPCLQCRNDFQRPTCYDILWQDRMMGWTKKLHHLQCSLSYRLQWLEEPLLPATPKVAMALKVLAGMELHVSVVNEDSTSSMHAMPPLFWQRTLRNACRGSNTHTINPWMPTHNIALIFYNPRVLCSWMCYS